MVASGKDVLIYNMETALVEKTFRGHHGRVIHMKNDPNDPLQVSSSFEYVILSEEGVRRRKGVRRREVDEREGMQGEVNGYR